MKPGLAVLPLEVWADVLVFPWITREKLVQIVHKFKNRKFVEKLQFYLHDMGKRTLRDLTIEEDKEIPLLFSRASVLVSGRGRHEKYELAETEMPGNIRDFKWLTIRFLPFSIFIIFRYVDDQVLNFLRNIKPLFNNVVLNIEAMELAPYIHILFGHLLPLVSSIRRINCDNYCLDLLERKFPEQLASAKELHVHYAKQTSIPAYMNWLLKAPQPKQFVQHEPRFLTASATFAIINAIVEAVRQQFLAATTSVTFVVFLEFDRRAEQHNRVKEFTIENAATKEELTVRNDVFKYQWHYYGSEYTHYYVEILRNPIGANAKMREWIKQGALCYKKFNWYKWEEKQLISIDGLPPGPPLTIGRITNKDQAGDQSVDGDKVNKAGPSTSAKKMEK